MKTLTVILIATVVACVKSDILQGVILDEENLQDVDLDDIGDSAPLATDTVEVDIEDEVIGSSTGGFGNGNILFPNGTNTECDDVAIIGAGIAGSFAAWRLRHSNLSISVYEYSNRIGGRIFTSHINGVKGFNAELGAMRFHIPSHRLLNKTINELGLTIVPFTQGYGASNHTSMYLRGVHMRYDQLGKSLQTPYHLNPNERVPYDQLRWEIFINNTDYLQHPNKSSFYLKTKDGIPLYKQSIQAVFAKYLSSELVHYIEDVNSFLSDFGTTNAAYALPARDPITPGESSLEMSTVKEGMNALPRRLLTQFRNDSTKHHIYLKHHLLAIEKHGDTYTLHFDHNRNPAVKDQCAKKVILAVNRAALERLQWDVLKRPHMHKLITKSLRDAHAVKFFLAYDNAWWRNSKYYDVFAISDTPIHRTYDFGTVHGTNISVLDAVYSDNDVTLWEELVRRGPKLHGNSMHTVTNETVFIIHKYLAAIYGYPFENIPKPIGGVIGIWDSYPIGGAWQEWLPGYVMTDVERQMVQPSLADGVYVASNAFNTKSLSFWIESALEAAELVLQKFKMPSYLTN